MMRGKWRPTSDLTASLYDCDGAELGGIILSLEPRACESWVWCTFQEERRKALLDIYDGRNMVGNACGLLEEGFLGWAFGPRPRLKRNRLYLPKENEE